MSKMRQRRFPTFQMPILRRLLLLRAPSTGKSRLPKNGIGKSAKERNKTNSCSKTKTVRIHSKLLAKIPSQKIPVQPKRTQTPNSWSTSRYGSGLILHSTVSRLIGADKTGNSTQPRNNLHVLILHSRNRPQTISTTLWTLG